MRLSLLLCLLLVGCSTPPGRVVTGERVVPPTGFILLCNGPDAGPECGKVEPRSMLLPGSYAGGVCTTGIPVRCSW